MAPWGGGPAPVASVLVDVHAGLAWAVVAANAVAGVWALVAHRVPSARGRALWWWTVAAEVAIFVQVGVGVALVAGEGRDAPDLHQFYGFVAIVAVAILYSYRQQLEAARHLLYGAGGLFLAGLAVRAMLVW